MSQPDWVAQQKKVFTKWVNMHLKKRSPTLGVKEDLSTEFNDGIRLCALMEILSKKTVPHKPTPKTTTQYMRVSNLNIAFKMITSEGIKLVGCGAEDIEAMNEKLLLGLIWTLIQFYQISMNDKEKKSAKESLMSWVKAHLQTLPGNVIVKDFHQSWQDGVAFCALVKRAAPGAIDLDSLDTNKLNTLNKAFEIAERELGIPKLLDAEDIISSKPDEQSIMTYVSLFPEVYEAKGIPTPILQEDGTYFNPRPRTPPPPLPVWEDPAAKQRELEDEIERLRYLLKETETTKEDERAKREHAEDEMKRLRELLKQAENAKEEERARRERAEEEMRSHKCPDIAGAEVIIKQLRADNQDKLDKISKLTESAKKLKEEKDAQLAEVEAEIKRLKQQINDEQARGTGSNRDKQIIQELRAEIEALKELSANQKSKLQSGHELELAELKKVLRVERTAHAEEVVAFNEEKRKKADEYEEEVFRLRQQIRALQAQNEETIKKLEHDYRQRTLVLEQELTSTLTSSKEAHIKERGDIETEYGHKLAKLKDEYEDSIRKMKEQRDKEVEEQPPLAKPVSNNNIKERLFDREKTNTKFQYSLSRQGSMLHEAARSFDLSTLSTLLANGFDVNARDSNNNTALHVVSENAWEAAIKLLISYKANVNAKNSDGNAPLHNAVHNGNLININFLLNNGAEVNIKNNEGVTPLLLAAENLNADVIHCLLEHGANMEFTKTETGWGPLYTTCWYGNVECAQLFIKAGAFVDSETSKGWSPLFAAAANGHMDIVALLTKHKANVNKMDFQNTTPLFHSVAEDHEDIAAFLLKQAIATSEPSLDIVTCMLSNHADPNIMTQTGSTALHIAAHYGHEKIVHMLVKAGAKLGLKNAKGRMPVEVAANYGYKKIVDYLAKKQGIKAPALKKKTPKFADSSKPEKPSVEQSQ